MKVFATRFLEPMNGEDILPLEGWSWQPANSDLERIYASGAKTSTRQSTYANERDNPTDTDRPNEGYLVA